MTARTDMAPGLRILDHMPKGCILYVMPTDKHAPLIRTGDFVVVDPADVTIQWGELFLVLQSRGPVLWQIVPENEERAQRRSEPDRICAWLRPLQAPDLAHGRIFMADGPILVEYLQGQIVGRAIGVFRSAFEDPRLQLTGRST